MSVSSSVGGSNENPVVLQSYNMAETVALVKSQAEIFHNRFVEDLTPDMMTWSVSVPNMAEFEAVVRRVQDQVTKLSLSQKQSIEFKQELRKVLRGFHGEIQKTGYMLLCKAQKDVIEKLELFREHPEVLTEEDEDDLKAGKLVVTKTTQALDLTLDKINKLKRIFSLFS